MPPTSRYSKLSTSLDRVVIETAESLKSHTPVPFATALPIVAPVTSPGASRGMACTGADAVQPWPLKANTTNVYVLWARGR